MGNVVHYHHSHPLPTHIHTPFLAVVVQMAIYSSLEKLEVNMAVEDLPYQLLNYLRQVTQYLGS